MTIKEINIVVCGDKNIEIGLHCTLYSLLSKSTILFHHIFFIHDGYEKKDFDKLNQTLTSFDLKYELIPIQMDCAIFKNFKGLHGNKFAYSKLMIADLIPVDEVIYLDLDTIVNIDISKLAGFKYDEYVIAANKESTIGASIENKLYKMLGFNSDAPYFNSGIMIMNLNLWRARNLTIQCLEFASKYPDELNTADQSVLNFCFYNNFKQLPDFFNDRISNKMSLSEIKSKESILHFYGRPKPWDLFAEFVHPQYSFYKDVLSNTYFKNYKSYKCLSKSSIKKFRHTYKSYIRALLKL